MQLMDMLAGVASGMKYLTEMGFVHKRLAAHKVREQVGVDDKGQVWCDEQCVVCYNEFLQTAICSCLQTSLKSSTCSFLLKDYIKLKMRRNCQNHLVTSRLLLLLFVCFKCSGHVVENQNICSCKQSIVPGAIRALPTRVVSSHTVSVSPPDVSRVNESVSLISGAG